ncbi:Nuclear cap-binding protein subunit 1 [Coemansia javaensis]|uniref:Nuclear cap-binding protein subunit 1 n=1 Tax=Coemansia javaensis TaxID=2761396 RepID=A0A9W8HFX6_9FUNG|nr:Nuclear cap-binding protein subunit 1 [Coemansia javaensis]
MDYSGRAGGGRYGGGGGGGGGPRRDVDEFGRDRRSRPHQRKPYDRPMRGGFRGGGGHAGGGGGAVVAAVDEATDIESRLASLIVKVGDKNTPTLQNNLDALSVVLEKDYGKHEATVLRTFRQCVLELPWKATVYAALAGLLNAKNGETGAKVVGLLHGVLQREAGRANWSAVKVLMRFFALLVGTNAIAAGTLLGMLDAFLAPVAAEPAPSARNSCYVAIAMSTLLWGGRSLQEQAPAELAARLQAAEQYVQRAGDGAAYPVAAVTTVLGDAPARGPNGLAQLLDVLRAVAAGEWRVDAIFSPHALFTSELEHATRHELPALELPAGLAPGAFYTPPEFLQLVPSPPECAVRRFVLQDLVADTVAQLEGNRKDCARYVLQIHRLCNEDVCTVMSAAGRPENGGGGGGGGDNANDDNAAMGVDDAADPETSLVFEYAVAEALLTLLLQLPEGRHREMYYAALAIELRKAEPQAMAAVFEAAVGNLVARAAALDVECINRLSNWLAVYVSNFGFKWDWRRWEDVAGEPEGAPRRRFVQETLLKLVRLSYLDRIRAQLPEGCAGLVPAKTPTHNFKFTVQAMDERTREVSVALGRCLKAKGTVEQAMEILQTHYSQWTDVDDDARQALAREMLVEHVLLLGSKTFSHMLNAIEKFMPALQQFGDSPEAKVEIARVVEDFWRNNSQFFAITIDKLVNYRVIDPSTVVEMLFGPPRAAAGGWAASFHVWEILRNTVNKVNMRVAQLQARVAAAESAIEVDDDTTTTTGEQQQQQETKASGESVEHVRSILAQMEREQRDVVVLTTQHLARLLAPGAAGDETDRAWLLGRFKEFARTYRAQLAANAAALDGLDFAPDVRSVYDAARALAA